MYIGQTGNLKRRLAEYKSIYSDFELIYCEIYKSKKDAVKREIALKQFGNAYKQLKRRIKNSLNF
jgi:predicted GIY-YIG superfamily endonuclease